MGADEPGLLTTPGLEGSEHGQTETSEVIVDGEAGDRAETVFDDEGRDGLAQ